MSIKNSAQNDKSIIYIVFLLLLFGLLMIYNATSYSAQDLFGNAFRFVYLQFAWILIGAMAFFAFSNINYKKLEGISYFLFFGNVLLLVLLALVGLFGCTDPTDTGISFAPCINGASRWFYFNPAPFPEIPFFEVLSFQPGELVKLTLIMYLSVQLGKFTSNSAQPFGRGEKNENKDAFMVYFVTASVVAFLLVLQPNVSTAILVFALATVIYFVSSLPLKPLLTFLPVAMVFVVIAVFTLPHTRSRIITQFRGESVENVDAGPGYHIKQILISLGSGGIFGVGLGQSRQKYQYLPEIATDSIFAIIGEELGYIGTTLVILGFGFLIYKGMMIAKEAPDDLGRMLASGIISWIAIQFFVNVAAMTRLIPLTGVPIPLISYGGSSMVFSMIGLGILLNVQKNS